LHVHAAETYKFIGTDVSKLKINVKIFTLEKNKQQRIKETKDRYLQH